MRFRGRIEHAALQCWFSGCYPSWRSPGGDAPKAVVCVSAAASNMRPYNLLVLWMLSIMAVAWRRCTESCRMRFRGRIEHASIQIAGLVDVIHHGDRQAGMHLTLSCTFPRPHRTCGPAICWFCGCYPSWRSPGGDAPKVDVCVYAAEPNMRPYKLGIETGGFSRAVS